MTFDQDSPFADPLAQATAALKDMPIPAGPSAEATARAQQIPNAHRIPRLMKTFKALAAGLAFLILGLVAFQLLRHSGGLAFADVVQAVKETHTFTGTMEIPLAPAGAGVPEGMHFSFNVSVKGSSLRAESSSFTAIADFNTHKIVVLFPMLHKVGAEEAGFDKEFLDIYGMLRAYHTGAEKAAGEKIIGGHKMQGFQLSRPGDNPDQPAQIWTFWIDPATKLPVEVDILDPHLPDPMTLGNLRFDVPLDDALFDMKVPAGYTLLDDPAKADPTELKKYSGRIVDQRGKPIAGVEVTLSTHDDTLSPGACGPEEPVKTDKDGRFSIDARPEKAGFLVGVDLTGVHTKTMEVRSDDPIRLEFRHPDFIYGRLEDVRLLPPEARGNLQITLHDGKSVSGKVVDSAGHAVGGARVEAVYFQPDYGRFADEVRFNYRKVVATDADGKFQLLGLSPDNMVVQVRRISNDARVLWGQATLNLRESGNPAPLQIIAGPLALPPGKIVHELFGMKLVDVDDDLRSRLSLGAYEHVLILDPGPNVVRLHIGKPSQGDCFWIVQDGLTETRVKNYAELCRQLRAACESQKRAAVPTFQWASRTLAFGLEAMATAGCS